MGESLLHRRPGSPAHGNAQRLPNEHDLERRQDGVKNAVGHRGAVGGAEHAHARSAAFAVDKPRSQPAKKTQANQQKPADTVELCGITWHRKLPDALKAAKGDAGKDRPVMVLRVLGALDGFM